MLETVDIGEPSLAAYRGVAPDATLDELVSRAEALRGARVLHLNATPYGEGVSELLRSTVLLREPEQAEELGAQGREHVRKHLLLPRLILDEVSLMLALG